MAGPLTGIKVVEVANFLAVPCCAALMADMGADVIKVEPLAGDPYRWMSSDGTYGFEFPINYAFEMDNRGKRGISLDLNKPEASDIVRKLTSKADVFVTNLLPRRLEKFSLTYEQISADNPRLIYLAFSGYGPVGPKKDKLGFDHTAYWASTGLMDLYSQLSSEPIDILNGMGDHTTAPTLLAGVLAAILERQRTGKGRRVTASLLNMGLWVIGADVQEALASGRPLYRRSRVEAIDPLINTYSASDGKWFLMVMPDSDSNWAKLCKAIGHPELIDDPRFATIDGRKSRAPQAIAALDGIFNEKPLADWVPILDANDVIYAPVREMLDALTDPQVELNDMLRTIEHPQHGPYKILNTPVHLEDTDIGPKSAAPELGQHTEEVLLELGYSWDDITGLQDSGAITGG